MNPPGRHADLLRQSRLALGVVVVCLLFGAETVVAHHVRPNPASVWVWGLLGLVGALALGAYVRLRRQCRQAPDRPGAPPLG